MSKQYGAESIKLLRFPDAIRARSGMYIGSTDKLSNGTNPAIYQITKEVLDNAVDEHLSKHANKILIKVCKNEITIADNGRGIPIEYHKDFKTSTLVGVFSNMHASGKFDKDSYETSIGLNGVGSKCTNALSESFKVWTNRSNKWYSVAFKKGVLTQDVKKTSCPIKGWDGGTVVSFIPDSSILQGKLDFDKLHATAKILSYITSAYVTLEKAGKSKTFHSKHGLLDYLPVLNKKLEGSMSEAFHLDKDGVNVAMCWIDKDSTVIESFVNASPTRDGGTHVKGLQKAITDAFKHVYKKANFDWQDISSGLLCALAKNVSEVKFDSQTKDRLITKEAEQETYDVVYPNLIKWIKRNNEFCDDLVAKAERLKAIRSKATDERAVLKALKGKRGKSDLPPTRKFAISTTKNPEERMLYICLAGDTKVQLVDGSSIAIKDMVGKTCYYGFGMNMSTGICEPVHFSNIRKTRENQELVRVTLDNGKHFDCTPDHLVVTLNNDRLKFSKTALVQLREKALKYVRADELKPGQSLCSLSLTKDWFSSSTSGQKKIHREVYRKFCGKLKTGYHIHHIDGNHSNNVPENLVQLTHSAHSKITNYGRSASEAARFRMSIAQKRYFSDNRNRLKTSIATKLGMQNVDFTNIKSALISRAPINRAKSLQRLWLNTVSELQSNGLERYVYRRAKNLRLDKVRAWFDSDYDLIKYIKSSKRCLLPFRVNVELNKHLDFERLLYIASRLVFNCIEVSEKSIIEHNDIDGFDAESALKKYGLDFVKEFVSEYNHKVVSVRKLHKKQDVYCLNAEGLHNFALECGIFVKNCEGDSAAGAAKNVRNPKIHEILALRGKIMNAVASDKKIFESEEVMNILKAIGYNEKGTWRVGKVVIFADADPDGDHITSLVLGVIMTVCPKLIKEGRVYTVDAPLFIGKTSTTEYYGKDLADLYRQSKSISSITRVKGWGECPAAVLKKVAFSDETKLNQIQYEDVDYAEVKKIMGSNGLERKALLELLK